MMTLLDTVWTTTRSESLQSQLSKAMVSLGKKTWLWPWIAQRTVVAVPRFESSAKRAIGNRCAPSAFCVKQGQGTSRLLIGHAAEFNS